MAAARAWRFNRGKAAAITHLIAHERHRVVEQPGADQVAGSALRRRLAIFEDLDGANFRPLMESSRWTLTRRRNHLGHPVRFADGTVERGANGAALVVEGKASHTLSPISGQVRMSIRQTGGLKCRGFGNLGGTFLTQSGGAQPMETVLVLAPKTYQLGQQSSAKAK